MNRHAKFVTCVQTAVLALEPEKLGEAGAVSIVADACDVPEEAVPEDVAEATLEFMLWKTGCGFEPDWHAATRGQ